MLRSRGEQKVRVSRAGHWGSPFLSGSPMVQARTPSRLGRGSHRDKIVLLLLLLLMFLAAVAGLYLASQGLHPRQLRRRLPSRSGHQVEVVMAVQHFQGLGWNDVGEQNGSITAHQGENA